MRTAIKLRTFLKVFIFFMLMNASPISIFASEEPNLIPRIEVSFAMGVTVTLTDVHEYFLDFGNHSIGVWMPPNGTIAFNFAGEPNCPVLGTLYEGIPFPFQDVASKVMGSDLEWFYWGTFFLAQTPIQGELAISVDAEHLIARGLDDWFVLNINGFPSFDWFAYHLQTRGRPLREREIFPQQQLSYETAMLIPSITIRPPLFYGEADLLITFTYVYDVMDAVGITGMTSYQFHIAPTGSVSFNRDVEFIEYTDDGMNVMLTAQAGEIVYVREHPWLSIYYGTYTFDEFPYRQRLYLTFIIVHDPVFVPLLFYGDWAAICGLCMATCRISVHDRASDTSLA